MTWFGSGGNSVLVYTTENQYSPGECIQGHVLVNIVSHTNYTGLVVKLSAKERVRFDDQEAYQVPHFETHTVDGRTETRTTMRTEYRTVCRVGKHHLFRTEIMILSGGDLVPGQVSVPFSFVLPPGLPGSFAMSGFGFNCGVYYKVKALLRVPGILKSNLRSEKLFDVVQAPPPVTQSITGTNGSKISVCCCINRGYAQLEFKCTRDAFHPGEVVSLVASATNNSSSNLQRLTVKLRRYIQLHDNFGHSKVFETTISEAVYPGIPPRSSIKDLPMTLQIPPDAPQQCFGVLIRCLYSVRLSGKVKCGTDATCTVPANIYRSNIATGFIPPADPSWNPTTMAPVAIGLNVQPMLPQPIQLNHYPGVETMIPSAPIATDHTQPVQQRIPDYQINSPQNKKLAVPEQPGLDPGFMGK